jgi:hypothetical protein
MDKTQSEKKSRPKYLIPSLILLGLLLAFGSVAYVLKHRQNSTLPANVASHINFTVYVPPNDIKQTYEIDRSSITYNKNTGVLTMTAIAPGNKIYITEQAQPDTFSDIPQYYPQLLDRLHQYAEFQTAIGTVTLTHPTELNGGQSAVSKAGGTLTFAHPEHNFFDSLEIVK